MEKYMTTCRVILVTNSTSKVIPAISSRFLAWRVPAPTMEEISTLISSIANKEGCFLLSQAARRVEKSNRNLRRAILMVEACNVAPYPFSGTQPIQYLDWEM